VNGIPKSREAKQKLIQTSKVGIFGRPIYYYNRLTGTRWLTYREFETLAELNDELLAKHLQEIAQHTLHMNRLNRPVFIADLSQDLITDREAVIFGYFEGGMVVPLIYKTHLAGLFLLADKIAGGTFTQDEIEFISALGNQISVASENARLYEGEKAANEQLWAAQEQLVQA
jgi:GAF domain-containing protein